MSYGVMPFAVEFEAIHDLFGCCDKGTLAKYLNEMARELDALDNEEEEEVRELLPARVALRQIIMGEPLDAKLGHIYAYLIEAICSAYDTVLGNYYWCPIRSDWLIGEFDATLREAGVSPTVFSMKSHLLFRGCPFPIPKPHDFPRMGYLTPEEVWTATEHLTAVDAERFRPIVGYNQFVTLREWFETCRDTGRGFLCFYH